MKSKDTDYYSKYSEMKAATESYDPMTDYAKEQNAVLNLRGESLKSKILKCEASLNGI